MANLSSSKDSKTGVLTIKFEGALDEDSQLEKIEFPGVTSLVIDAQGIRMINSVGIRSWRSWLQNVPSNIKISLVNCPKLLVDQANMIRGFIPENGKIQSFQVPYYCTHCDNITNVMTENQGPQTYHNIPESIPCSHCGKDTEIDVTPSSYLRFIK